MMEYYNRIIQANKESNDNAIKEIADIIDELSDKILELESKE